VAIIGALILIQETREAGRKTTFDIPGILLVSLGVGAIVFGLIEGQAYGWLQPKQVFTLGSWSWPLANIAITPFSFLLGVLALAGFVSWENRLRARGSEPLFDFGLLRFRGFRFGLLTVAIVALGEFAIVFVLSLYLQGVRGLTAFQVGLTLLPFAILTLFVAPLAGLLSSRFGPKWVVTAGMLFEAVAIYGLSLVFGVDTPLIYLTLFLMLYGVGVGLAIAQLTSVVLSEVPPDRLGAGSGANNTIRQLGAAMGIAIIGAILTSGIASSATTQFNASKDLPASIKTAIVQSINNSGGGDVSATSAGAPPGSENTPIGKEITHIIQQSFVDGARGAAQVASVFVLLGAVSSLLIPNTTQRRSKEVLVSE
jgi:Na+/melibiose symporter-like transporter